MTDAELQTGIQETLQEIDVDRTLDSLDNVIIVAYLVGRDLDAAARLQPMPTTIRGWVTWARQYLPTG